MWSLECSNRYGDEVFNAAVLAGPDGLVGSYRKVHLPFLGVDRFTTPGNRPFEVFDVAGVRVGILICYDGGFPEAVRELALRNADLVVLPTNWPPGAETMAEYAVNTRAMENAIYFLAANRVGKERGFRFIGTSRICDPAGNTLAGANGQDECVIRAESTWTNRDRSASRAFQENTSLIALPIVVRKCTTASQNRIRCHVLAAMTEVREEEHLLRAFTCQCRSC